MALLEINDKVYKIPNKVMKAFEDMSDYIKELEEEKEELKSGLDEQSNISALLAIKNKELEEENKKLSKNQRYYKNGVFSLENDKETMSDMIDDYKSRIDKAIEYIKDNASYDEDINRCCDDLWDDDCDDLLKILKGEENGRNN